MQLGAYFFVDWVLLPLFMKIAMWNVRGLGKSEKKRVVRRLLSKRRCDMVFIQESKLEVVNSKIWHFLGGYDSFTGEYASSVRAAGGLIILWDEKFFRVENKLVSNRYILLIGEINSKNFKCRFGNIYAPNDDRKRQAF